MSQINKNQKKDKNGIISISRSFEAAFLLRPSSNINKIPVWIKAALNSATRLYLRILQILFADF